MRETQMPKPRGRPRQFDEQLVRQAILQTFWENGYTATHLLLIAKEYNSVRFLIKEGASVQIPGPEGETAYDLMHRKQLQGLLDLVEERD